MEGLTNIGLCKFCYSNLLLLSIINCHCFLLYFSVPEKYRWEFKHSSYVTSLQGVLKRVILLTCRFLFTPIYIYHICWFRRYLRHKNIVMLPQLLLAHTPPIPFHTLKQSRGEYVITFPSAFHFVCIQVAHIPVTDSVLGLFLIVWDCKSEVKLPPLRTLAANSTQKSFILLDLKQHPVGQEKFLPLSGEEGWKRGGFPLRRKKGEISLVFFSYFSRLTYILFSLHV